MINNVAIGFFGLTRSLKYTIKSIEQNIFNVLKKNNIKYDIYLHTYNLEKLTLKRSGEKNCILDVNEWKLLNPIKYKIDNQNDFDKSYDYDSIKKYGDTWRTNFQNVYNLIRQLNSLKELYKLFEDEKKYDCYILLRPDLFYHDKLDLNIINKVNNNIVTPKWQRWGGLNDRFCFGKKNTIKIYCNRINECLNYCSHYNTSINSEKLLLFCIKKNNITPIFTKMRASRIRANGKKIREKWK